MGELLHEFIRGGKAQRDVIKMDNQLVKPPMMPVKFRKTMTRSRRYVMCHEATKMSLN